MATTSLHAAASIGDAQSLRELKKTLAGRRDEEGRTALMLAAMGGHTACVQELVEDESRLRDNSGRTALMYAVLEGHSGCIRLLVRAEVRLLDGLGRSPLMYALLYRRIGYVDLLIRGSRLQTVEAFDEFRPGTTALMIAARLGHLQAVRALKSLEGTRERVWKDAEGRTAVDHAVAGLEALEEALGKREDYEAIIEVLKGEGKETKETKETKEEEETKEDSTKEDKEEATKEAVTTASVGMTALMFAAFHGDEAAVRRLLPVERGAQSRFGWSALMFAAAAGHADVVALLRPHESRLRDCNGWTALMLATENGHEDCVRLLLVESDLRVSRGPTALSLAQAGGQPTIVALLKREREKDKAKRQRKKGLTPLMRAVIRDDVADAADEEDVADADTDEGKKKNSRPDQTALLEYVGHRDRDGLTALMRAVLRGRRNWVQRLARYELGLQDDYGATALMYAVGELQDQLLAPLLNEADLRDECGRTALDIAYEIRVAGRLPRNRWQALKRIIRRLEEVKR